MASPSISLCMIVRDEAEMIAQAISSVARVVSQIVVVDTGSQDDTQEIAKGFGAELYTYQWEDDFSAPRNFSIEKATGEWILVLDADEAIAERDLSGLVELTQAKDHCWLFSQRHYSSDHRMSGYRPNSREYPEWETRSLGYFESQCVRLFPKHPDIYYQGRIHELVEHSIRASDRFKIVPTEIRIQHFGHIPEVRNKRDKSRLYSDLGTAKLAEQPTDWKSYYELAIEHHLGGRLEQSVQAFEKSIELNTRFISSYVNLGYILCEMKDYRKAERVLKVAISLDPLSSEAFCNLAVVRMREQRYQEAEPLLRQAIRLNQVYVNAYCNLAISLSRLGRLSEAANVLELLLELSPKCIPALSQLGAIYHAGGVVEKAVQYLERALGLDPNNNDARLLLGEIRRGASAG